MKFKRHEAKGLLNTYNNFRKMIKEYIENENEYFSLISIDSINEEDKQVLVEVTILDDTFYDSPKEIHKTLYISIS